jgi:hypothetical protein
LGGGSDPELSEKMATRRPQPIVADEAASEQNAHLVVTEVDDYIYEFRR